jgi:pescadillo
MPKKLKAGEAGAAVNYVTRNKAIRLLQVTLKDFRRLCILKGIYPRDPPKKKKGKDKTYYHVKDVKFLRHEPLLAEMRAEKTRLAKQKRAEERKDYERLKRLKASKSAFSIDHIIKERYVYAYVPPRSVPWPHLLTRVCLPFELPSSSSWATAMLYCRYPTFLDALRDLDDALCMVHLFAMLPTKTVAFHDSAISMRCIRLSREYQSYVAHVHGLRKTFVSIKGFYYQAEVQSQQLTWLVPHKFTQQLPSDGTAAHQSLWPSGWLV